LNHRVVALEEVDQVTGLDGAALSIDDFDLLSILGQGAWGKVVAARHRHSNIVFALKIMKKKMLIEQGDAKYIIRERKIMSELLHPFILNLHGHFSTPTKLYMVLSLASGGDMAKMLSKQQHNNYRLTTSVARFVIAQVILAIEYMHGRGVVHRDIKTENILIDANGYCILADMGLACICSEAAGDPAPQSAEGVEPKTLGSSLWVEPNIKKHENHLINRRQGANVRCNRSSLLGTPEYLAPEILRTSLGGTYGASADWWAVGILLYELLHGSCGFDFAFQIVTHVCRCHSICSQESGCHLRQNYAQ
jgi:serine/threonine protein kinase